MHLIIVNTERILCSLADIPPVHGGLVGYRSGSKDVSAWVHTIVINTREIIIIMLTDS